MQVDQLDIILENPDDEEEANDFETMRVVKVEEVW